MKKINCILNEKLEWKSVTSKYVFTTEKYPVDVCYLRMNDFPEEPLWTLFYNGDSIDIEDTPLLWKINYRSK